MKKHAYLIIAHNQFELLEMTLRILDDERNDFYIHIDSAVQDFDFERFKAIPQFSSVTFVKRRHIAWGAFTMVQAEWELLKAAVKKQYAYYHLLSGVDLPLKTPDEICAFFEENNGKEFLHFCSEEFQKRRNVQERIRLFHFLQERVGRTHGLLYKIERILLRLQRLLHVDRLKNSSLTFRCGGQWFSITHALATDLCEQEDTVNKYFRHTNCADEVVVQTLAYSAFGDELNRYHPEWEDDYRCSARLIDWKRGEPYVFRAEDMEELRQSDCMFARKFDLKVDQEICTALFEYLMNKKRTE